ncbi:MAG: hypothetical protein ACRD6I_11595 [Candidatus Acidiferrales bacterium]
MAKILADHQIRNLLGSAILNASPDCVRSNSYELRLGKKVRFDSTSEEFDIPDGHFLEIPAGEFITIASLEKLDFSREALDALQRKSQITALITPTTTMMREGFLFTTTRVDPGFRGVLNWGMLN